MMLLPPVPTCWDCRQVPPCAAAKEWTQHIRWAFNQLSCILDPSSAFSWKGIETRDCVAVNWREGKVLGKSDCFWPGMSFGGRTNSLEDACEHTMYTWLHMVITGRVCHGLNLLDDDIRKLAAGPGILRRAKTLWNAQRLLTAAIFKEKQRKACRGLSLDPGAACWVNPFGLLFVQ